MRFVPVLAMPILASCVVSCGSEGSGEWGRPEVSVTFPDIEVFPDEWESVAPDPGTTDPGTDPVKVDPGVSTDAFTDPGIVDSGQDHTEVVDPGASDPGTPDPGPPDPGQPDIGCVTDEQCPAGHWCNAPDCVPCETDTKCGPQCLPCEAPLFCKNGKCVECFITECGEGAWCDAGFCKPCTDDDPGHCGADCEPCLGKFPDCVGGECVCAEGSCGVGKVCLDGDCAVCDLDEHCGTDCVKCEAPASHCLDGTHCVACSQDTHCDGALVCSPEGSCVECVVHAHCGNDLFCDNGVCTDACNTAQGCTSDDGPDGEKCDKAKIIGRKAAMAGYVYNGDTTGDGNNDDLSFPLFEDKSECWDADEDNYFRIYLVPGDTLDASVDPDQFDSMMKIYYGTGCKAGGNDYECFNSGSSNKPDVISSWNPPAEGWYTIVVDGRRSMDDDDGPYTFQLQLTCDDPNCCCGL